MKIAILGAQGTGKTELTLRLAGHFEANGQSVCLIQSHTPRQGEQLCLAQEQARRVSQAPHGDLVIADTTPLMIAIYSDLLFDDPSLYGMALAHQRSFDVTLVTGLDLPWMANGLQCDSPQMRESVDGLLRTALVQGNIPYHVVYGTNTLRTENALKCVERHARSAENLPLQKLARAVTAETMWVCERCSDADCEHRLFTALLNKM